MAVDKRLTIRKRAKIRREDHLREVLMNLFEKMELNPVLTHGALEYGKEIVCTEKNHFGMLEWIGAGVKVGKIRGGTSGSSSLQTVFNQVQEVFQHPYKDPVTKQKNGCVANSQR